MTNPTPSFTELLALTNKELVGQQEQFAKANQTAFATAPVAPPQGQPVPKPVGQPVGQPVPQPVGQSASQPVAVPTAQPVPVAQAPASAPLPPAPGATGPAPANPMLFTNNHVGQPVGQPVGQHVGQPDGQPVGQQPATPQTFQPVAPPAPQSAPQAQTFQPVGPQPQGPVAQTFKPVSAPQPVAQGALSPVSEAVEAPKFNPTASFDELSAGAQDLTTPQTESLRETSQEQPVPDGQPLQDVLASVGITMFAEESKGEIPVATEHLALQPEQTEEQPVDETVDKTSEFAVSISALETPVETTFETPATDVTPVSEQPIAGVTRDELTAIIREVIHNELNHEELKSVVKGVLIDVLSGLTK